MTGSVFRYVVSKSILGRVELGSSTKAYFAPVSQEPKIINPCRVGALGCRDEQSHARHVSELGGPAEISATVGSCDGVHLHDLIFTNLSSNISDRQFLSGFAIRYVLKVQIVLVGELSAGFRFFETSPICA